MTPSDFPLARLTQMQLDGLPISASNIDSIYPLSPMQQGILFHALYRSESGDYINQMRVDVEGLDVERFRQAWAESVEAHDILRTAFVLQPDLHSPLQVVLKQVKLPFISIDWRTHANRGYALDELAAQERERCFVLGEAPLIRMAVVRVGEHGFHLIYTSQHILLDGWSGSNLLGEILSRYSGVEVLAEGGRYADFIAWQQRQDIQVAERFWAEQLESLEHATLLAGTAPKVAEEEKGGLNKDHYLTLDQKFTSRLKKFAQRRNVTVNTLVQSAWALLLSFYTGNSTVVFGATVAGRPVDMKGIEKRVGLFINTLPLVVELNGDPYVDEWIIELQEKNLRARAHEHFPLRAVQRLAGQRCLFDSVVIFENYPVSGAIQEAGVGGLVFKSLTYHEQTNYPMTLYVTLGDKLVLDFSYKSVLDDELVARLGEQLMLLLGSMARADGRLRLTALRLQLEKHWKKLANGSRLPTDQALLSREGIVGARSTGSHVLRENVYVPPETSLQKQLAFIWQSVLGIENVGMDDDFFELGGDSISSLNVLVRVRQLDEKNFQMELHDLFEKPTIRMLTAGAGYSTDKVL
ncbi:Linear gramicidin synthase subunit D [compost metagenome]